MKAVSPANAGVEKVSSEQSSLFAPCNRIGAGTEAASMLAIGEAGERLASALNAFSRSAAAASSGAGRATGGGGSRRERRPPGSCGGRGGRTGGGASGACHWKWIRTELGGTIG